jgi:23S rRNA (adenine2503-C2)-methyltransferase
VQVIAKTGDNDLAMVYLARENGDKIIEFVEAVQPPVPRDKKWVLIISTMYGCPIQCPFCDAGGSYQGMLSTEDMLFQTDYLVSLRYPDSRIPAEKFKVQFARIGEPALNDAVIDVLERLPSRYDAPGLMPCVSTIAPAGHDRFFEKLLFIKKGFYKDRFQLQFSMHTTDIGLRDWMVPAKKWDFSTIADYGNIFYDEGGRKITLNFALAEGMPVDPGVLRRFFDPRRFMIKVTPQNPTTKAVANNIRSCITRSNQDSIILDELRNAGFDVLLSIGEWRENQIGSNCGQYITNNIKSQQKVPDSYTYPLVSLMPPRDVQD